MVVRKAKRPPHPVRLWVRYLRNAARVEHCRITQAYENDAVRLAALVALVGPQDDDRARQAFWALKSLFLKTSRQPYWAQTIDVIPPEEASVMQLVACCKAFERHVGNGDRLRKAQMKLTQVVEVMLDVPDPGAYVKALAEDGFDHPGGIFHPNTLAVWLEQRRGWEDPTSRRTREEHQGQAAQQVDVVRD